MRPLSSGCLIPILRLIVEFRKRYGWSVYRTVFNAARYTGIDPLTEKDLQSLAVSNQMLLDGLRKMRDEFDEQ